MSLLLVGVAAAGERVEEKEAVINRTNHASARRCAGWSGVERGWRCWVPIPIWGWRRARCLDSIRFDGVSTLLFLFTSLSLSSSEPLILFLSLLSSLVCSPSSDSD